MHAIMRPEPFVAYFSMEIALVPDMPTYSGGLGVLAGDTLRSAADLAMPMAAVTLIHRKGYFRQELDPEGGQIEHAEEWCPRERLEPLAPRIALQLDEREVAVAAWRYVVNGHRGEGIPVYLLDTDLPENAPEDRGLTDQLYGGDDAFRLRQEAVLGIGGVEMLQALGERPIDRYHLNEGHAALAVLALYEQRLAELGEPAAEAVAAIRERCVFTTHTPVPAGHDRFSRALVEQVLGSERAETLRVLGVGDVLNLTELALENSRFVNGVAMRHGEVSRGMFPSYPVRSITNGVHPGTWTAAPMRALFDRYVPYWRSDPLSLRYAVSIPNDEIRAAHQMSKDALLETVRLASGAEFDPAVLTLGFARRATGYKRATLIFRDLARLEALVSADRPLQIVYAGKAHPKDHEGKQLIRAVFDAANALRGRLSVAYLPGYDMHLGALLTAGSDLWLNTPIPPLEASGTSGMKAALNGVPSLSILDGWWVEGCIEGVTGWAIGNDGDDEGDEGVLLTPEERDANHADDLYEKLETAVLPSYYDAPERYCAIMRNAIALNGSFFNTHRMLLQYLYEGYRDPGPNEEG